MMRLFGCALLLLAFPAHKSLAQGTAPAALSSPAKATPKPAAKDSEKSAAKKDPLAAGAGGSFGAPTNEAITTEIYSEAADFNSKEYIGTFTGKVIVKDPRFSLQADKLIVYLGRGEQKGLEKAIAEGNVAVVREAPGEEGGAPVRSIGRAERAVYTTLDGNIEMTGTPRVQSGLNMHVATSPETVMVINRSGQLTTRGPSRTEIRQEPKTEPTPKP